MFSSFISWPILKVFILHDFLNKLFQFLKVFFVCLADKILFCAFYAIDILNKKKVFFYIGDYKQISIYWFVLIYIFNELFMSGFIIYWWWYSRNWGENSFCFIEFLNTMQLTLDDWFTSFWNELVHHII